MISSPDLPVSSESDVEQTLSVTPQFKEFSEKLNALSTPEEKVAMGLQFMRNAISQEGSPRFREFWEARRQILVCFKENLNPAIRSKLWNEYVELTVEARRLKEILEEQSAFAMEQIDLAIASMEGEVGQFEALLSSSSPVQFPFTETMRTKASTYDGMQRELNILNNWASRLNSLRKEIIKTDMRIRFKTKFFKRLSDLGDKMFPKRKELIEKVSQAFEADITYFVDTYFKDNQATGAPYYMLREEIKSLQSMAKVLTLNSAVFTRTRLKLSECWDHVKVLEREHKKVVFERRQLSSEQRAPIQEKINAVKEKAEGMSLDEIHREIEEISNEMRYVQLTRDDVKALREELYQLKAPHLAAQEKKARELELAEKEKIRVRREKTQELKDRIAFLVKEGEAMELDALTASFETVHTELASLDLSKLEKQQIDRTLRPIKDLIAEKKEHSLLNLSDDDKKVLENFRLVLQEKKERRQAIKEQLEIYRKALGGSSLDFEKAMHYRELADQEKDRLDKANAGIDEIEQKIVALES